MIVLYIYFIFSHLTKYFLFVPTDFFFQHIFKWVQNIIYMQPYQLWAKMLFFYYSILNLSIGFSYLMHILSLNSLLSTVIILTTSILFWTDKQHFYYFFSDVVLFFVLDKIFLYLLSFHLVLFSLAFKLVTLVKINLFLVSVAKPSGFFLKICWIFKG